MPVRIKISELSARLCPAQWLIRAGERDPVAIVFRTCASEVRQPECGEYHGHVRSIRSLHFSAQRGRCGSRRRLRCGRCECAVTSPTPTPTPTVTPTRLRLQRQLPHRPQRPPRLQQQRLRQRQPRHRLPHRVQPQHPLRRQPHRLRQLPHRLRRRLSGSQFRQVRLSKEATQPL